MLASRYYFNIKVKRPMRNVMMRCGGLDNLPIFSTSKQDPAMRIEHARQIINDAETSFSNTSARIEYCRSKGVDYERTLEYMQVVEGLEGLTESLPYKTKYEISRTITSPNMSISLSIISTLSESCCPLCNQEHRLSLCPLLPDELRPFCD